MSEHILDLVGTGHFSTGRCSGCDWKSRGHANDVTRAFARQHDSQTEFVVPERVVIPQPYALPLLDQVEARIISVLAHHVEFRNPASLAMAVGLAEARGMIINHLLAGERSGDPREYVSILMARISHLSKHQRAKLRGRDRAGQQELLAI